MINNKDKIAAVIGNPIEHSFSPKLHNYLLKKHNIKNATYLKFKIEEKDLERSINAMKILNFAGFNVTIPYKEKIVSFCDQLTEEAKMIKAVNTVIIKNDKIYGHNSDGEGFIKSIKIETNFNFLNKKILVLGAGGAARSIIFSLLKNSPDSIVIANRNKERAEKILNDFSSYATRFNSRIIISDFHCSLKKIDMLINTTPLGMNGKELNIDLSELPISSVVCDIIYNPLYTKLLKSAEARGNKAINGIGMLVNQALVGFKAWFNYSPNIQNEEFLQLLNK